jgi:hypothetical protein
MRMWFRRMAMQLLRHVYRRAFNLFAGGNLGLALGTTRFTSRGRVVRTRATTLARIMPLCSSMDQSLNRGRVSVLQDDG